MDGTVDVDSGGPKVADEAAEAEFSKFIEAMDLDIDPEGMDDEDKASFQSSKRVVINSIKAGDLCTNESGELVFDPVLDAGKPIVFHEPTGASYMAMDQRKKNHDMAKMFATLADITKQNPKRFANMANRDIKVCLAIMTLFLA